MPELAARALTYRCPSWLIAMVQGLSARRPQVLITVAQAVGSTPRDAGARMWINSSGAVDTIGGGHLEQQAIEVAGRMLANAEPRRQLIRYPLGPSLGQCCGGVVWLAFEYLDEQDLAWCEKLRSALTMGRNMQRSVYLPADKTFAGYISVDAVQAENIPPCNSCTENPGSGRLVSGSTGELAATSWNETDRIMLDRILAPTFNVVVCGAGHVGQAIVRLLGELPVNVIWLDPRGDCWPAHMPDNVTCIEGDASEVVDCPDNAYWLVLTHSHALDLEIIEAVFQHKSFCFLGLIGSKTKKARFESRLKLRFSDELVNRIQCPIGLVATSSKLPSIIAISAVAQLLPWFGHRPG
mgnify:CR=1 FL=1